jgi:hypothetical protein
MQLMLYILALRIQLMKKLELARRFHYQCNFLFDSIIPLPVQYADYHLQKEILALMATHEVPAHRFIPIYVPSSKSIEFLGSETCQ